MYIHIVYVYIYICTPYSIYFRMAVDFFGNIPTLEGFEIPILGVPTSPYCLLVAFASLRFLGAPRCSASLLQYFVGESFRHAAEARDPG